MALPVQDTNGFRVYAPEECGRDGYPLEWHATIKHAVRESAGHRCIRCGHPYTKGAGEWSPCGDACVHGGPVRALDQSGEVLETLDSFLNDSTSAARVREAFAAEHEQVEAQWRILTVHHLDGDKKNCRWWNLVSLCQRCHLRVQRIVVMPRVWPWEHSDWFRPYAAGYYASVYLGEELERDEVEARLDELLGLERVEDAV